ncbi:MAG: N-acetylmuramic acid 6-phosphate etherase [Acidobacteriota bacterium]
MLTTEENNPRTTGIDRLSTIDALRLMNAEDQTVAHAVAEVLPAVARAVDAIVRRLETGGRLIYIGTGTSGRLGILDASECPPTFGVSPETVQGVIAGGYDACYRSVEASEDDAAAGAGALRERTLTSADAVVGIAASGSTPFTIGAVEYARGVGALTVGVTCNRGTELARVAEIAIDPVVGPEVVTGSTRLKSGTAQKLVLNMLSTMTMIRLGYVTGNRMSNLQARNIKLQQRAVGILQSECGIDERAAREALELASWDLPIAIVMQKSGRERPVVEQALRESRSAIANALELLKS